MTSPLTTATRSDSTPSGAARRSILADVTTIASRELLPVLRDPFSVVFGLIQPLFFLGLYGPLLAGSLGGADPQGVWAWFVPSILVMVTLFGTASTGSNLLYEFQTGAHERLLATPLSRSSLFLGRALKEIAPLMVQAAVVVVVMLPFGYRFDVLGAVLGLAILAVMGLGIGALSYTLAIAVRRTDWMFWVIQQTLLFPLMILSGMLLPLDSGPAWMRAASQVNPLTHVVAAEQALFTGRLADPAIIWGALAALATAALGIAAGLRALRRSID